MTAAADYYETLGVARDADAEVIKAAFRRLAHRFHPDVSSEPEAEQRFREVAEAYGVLSDPAKRAAYDAQGSASVSGAAAEDLWSGIDLTDVFGTRAPAFGDLFSRLFGPADNSPRGDDMHVEISISLDEVETGGDHEVTVPRSIRCPECDGRGSVTGTGPSRCPRCGGIGRVAAMSRRGARLFTQVTTCPECAGHGRITHRPCPACGNTGRATRHETIHFQIPPGVPDGATLRWPRRGTPNSDPIGPAGDVYLTIRTAPDPRFRRVGADLWHDLHLRPTDATLGVTTTVPLPAGQVRVRVPPGTQPGSVLRIAGKGLPSPDGAGRGNLQLSVVLDIPRTLSQRQRQLYERLRAEDAGGPPEGSGEPEVAQTVDETPPTTGQHPTAHQQVAGASVLLMLAAGASLIGGVSVMIASQILITDADRSDPGSWGWVLIAVGVLQLVMAAAVWFSRRPREPV